MSRNYNPDNVHCVNNSCPTGFPMATVINSSIEDNNNMDLKGRKGAGNQGNAGKKIRTRFPEKPDIGLATSIKLREEPGDPVTDNYSNNE